MAIILAAQNGNFTETSTWIGGVVPGVGDVAVANNKNVTINASVQCDEVRNDTTGGATVGGTFTLTNGVTLTANVFAGSATFGVCVTFSLSSPSSAAVIGNVTGGAGTNASVGVNCGGTGTLSITGNVTGGASAGGGAGVNVWSNGILNVTGTVRAVGGVGVLANTGSGIVNITGDVFGGTITTPGSGPEGARNYGANSATVINITGNVTGGSAAGAMGSRTWFAGIVNVTGNVYAGTWNGSSPTHGVEQGSTGTINVYGAAYGSDTVSGVAGANSGGAGGTLYVRRAIGNGFGPGSTVPHAGVAIFTSQNAITIVEEIEYGPYGQSPVSGAVRFADVTNNAAVFLRSDSTSKKTLIDPARTANLLPSASDVRAGVSYNTGSNTGTCAVPSPSSVVFGVPVDATTGTAVMTPELLWGRATADITTENSVGVRLENCLTAAALRAQLTGAT